MLIRPQQALQLARNNSKLLIFNNILKTYGIQASLSDLYQEKEDHPYSFVLFHTFSKPSYLTHCRSSNLALLHRVKERKTPSLSAQASFAPFSLKVAWSGKALIEQDRTGAIHMLQVLLLRGPLTTYCTTTTRGTASSLYRGHRHHLEGYTSVGIGIHIAISGMMGCIQICSHTFFFDLFH